MLKGLQHESPDEENTNKHKPYRPTLLYLYSIFMAYFKYI